MIEIFISIPMIRLCCALLRYVKCHHKRKLCIAMSHLTDRFRLSKKISAAAVVFVLPSKSIRFATVPVVWHFTILATVISSLPYMRAFVVALLFNYRWSCRSFVYIYVICFTAIFSPKYFFYVYFPFMLFHLFLLLLLLFYNNSIFAQQFFRLPLFAYEKVCVCVSVHEKDIKVY